MSFFLAVDLDEPVRAVVAACIERHRAEITAKWLRTDKLHVTLRFLGHPTAAELARHEAVRNRMGADAVGPMRFGAKPR